MFVCYFMEILHRSYQNIPQYTQSKYQCIAFGTLQGPHWQIVKDHLVKALINIQNLPLDFFGANQTFESYDSGLI